MHFRRQKKENKLTKILEKFGDMYLLRCQAFSFLLWTCFFIFFSGLIIKKTFGKAWCKFTNKLVKSKGGSKTPNPFQLVHAKT